MRTEACWCEQDQSADAAKHLHPSVAGTDTFHHLAFQRLHVAPRVCCGAAWLSREGLKQRGQLELQGWGQSPTPRALTFPLHNQLLSWITFSVFTLFSDIQKMHRCTWCVHRQTHPSYLKVKEAHSYTSVGLGFCANAALVHHYSSSVENGLEKLIIP